MHANHAHPSSTHPAEPHAGVRAIGVTRPADHHPGDPEQGRLNLLLSWGGWRPDSWADRMAALLEPLGITSLKARTARQAEQVIRTTPIHVAVVDLGLPLDFGSPSDEAGARILDVLGRLESPPPTVIVRSPRSSRDMAREMSAALRFDAFAVVDRRSADVELMLKVLQRAMERFYQGRWPHCCDQHRLPRHPHQFF